MARRGAPGPAVAPWGQAKALGLDVAPLKDAAGRLQRQVDAGQLPGFLSCVVKEDRLLHFEASGLADVCAGTSLRSDTLFRLYSQTKPVMVVGFMRLLERGAVSLTDPLAKYIPAFAKVAVGETREPLSRPITIHDLLAHTSGVGFGPGFFYEPENDYEETYCDLVRAVDGGRIQSLAEWCEELAELPLRFQPGTDWGYGYSSDLLGRVVEVASGRPLDVFLKEEVLEPLGMKDTCFAVPSGKAQRLAALYKREPWDGCARKVKFVTVDPGGSGLTAESKLRVYASASDPKEGGSAPSSSVFLQGAAASKVIQGGGCVCSCAGGLVSNMLDYARFGRMLLNLGELDGKRLLEAESVRLLARDWLNDFSEEKRAEPLWVWGTPGIGFSPLGQIGVEHPEATSRRLVGSQLHTVHWGGAGGSGYMLNWPHRVLVLTYTGCTLDTTTQKTMWRAAFGALRRGGAKPLRAWSQAVATEGTEGTPVRRLRGKRSLGGAASAEKKTSKRQRQGFDSSSRTTSSLTEAACDAAEKP